MEDCGATYAPAEPLIPEMCYSTLPSSGEVIKVFRGDRSYIPLKMPIDSATARKYADDMNRRLGVSKAQEAAMLAGSMFGWSVPAADARIMTKTAIHADRNQRIEVTQDERQQAHYLDGLS